MTSSKSKPHFCKPEAYELFETQVLDLNADGALLRAAVAISMHQLGPVDVLEIEDQLEKLASNIRARVRSDNPKALLTHAHHVLFYEEGFAGNVDNYYDPQNSYLPSVLRSKRGLPIALTLIYKEVLERLGLAVEGTNAPGHFLAGVYMDGKTMLVDPFFQGRVLNQQEAFDRIEQVIGKTPRSATLLRPATPRIWLARMLQNLQIIFEQSRERGELAAMLELHALLDDAPPEHDAPAEHDAPPEH